VTIFKTPARLSPVHTLHVQSGAVMTDVAGWQVVERYGDVEGEVRAVMASAGMCDISGRSAMRIKSFHLDGVLGSRSPAIGSTIKDDDTVIARLTTEEALALGPPPDVGSWQAGIDLDGSPSRYLTDVTSGLMAMKIVGPRAREVVASITDLDVRDRSLPDGSCAQAGFAQVHGTLLRFDVANTSAYELYVAREFGAYIWEVVLESLGHGIVVPFGNQALAHLEQQGSGS
jgi:heterotetrameric sarcosine oxidase gamma subunit